MLNRPVVIRSLVAAFCVVAILCLALAPAGPGVNWALLPLGPSLADPSSGSVALAAEPGRPATSHRAAAASPRAPPFA